MDSWLQVVKSLVMLMLVSSVMVSLSSTENLLALNTSKMTLKEIGNAQEGGLMIENYNDIKVDDIIEGYIMEEIKTLIPIETKVSNGV